MARRGSGRMTASSTTRPLLSILTAIGSRRYHFRKVELKPSRDFRGHLLGALGYASYGGPELGQDFLDAFGFQKINVEATSDELGCTHVRKKCKQRFPEA